MEADACFDQTFSSSKDCSCSSEEQFAFVGCGCTQMEGFLWCQEEMEEMEIVAHISHGEAVCEISSLLSSSSSSSASAVEKNYRWSPPWNCGNGNFSCERSSTGTETFSISFLLSKQAEFQTKATYARILRTKKDLCFQRSSAVRWIVKTQSTFCFSPVTAALAVNYLDRYAEKFISLAWRSWMMELLAIACLSLAAKMEEVDVPTLLDLQACDALNHAFEAKTVRRMELSVLDALNWRLNSITAFSFAEKILESLPVCDHFKAALMIRTSEILFSTFQEAAFLYFENSILAISSIFFALEEIVPIQMEELKLSVIQKIPLDMKAASKCYRQMESLIVDPEYTRPQSANIKSFRNHGGRDSSQRNVLDIARTVLVERIHVEDIGLHSKKQRTF
ncbi:hypothetical protein KP509_12G016800 [Ceratopteris richardii]|uniref:Cyclin-like domain-containing protein n=1 Tax=Ceratopteris richardii TaxID=49495 RepID=A0A8T2TPX4_CERRI|nr:hypothetical protein KP509_12G016800 [Ceratopteris richardii]